MDVLMHVNDGLSKGIFNEYVTVVHTAVSQSRGNIDCILGDQIFVTFNAHIPCSDPASVAMVGALELQLQLLLRGGDRVKFQVGASFGPVFASSVGYTKFKSMVTVGSPMKVASLLSHMARFENGAVLVDTSLEERVKYSCSLQPVELVHMPQLKTFAKSCSRSQRIFLLLGKKHLQEGEWIYQVGEGTSPSDWKQTFEQLVTAVSVEEGRSLLEQYLAGFPNDDIALRLKDRLPLWLPGAGIPL
eukprot:GGOE01060018.1.p1 GENE.GGOE01060018.1~~GGOE01060018.1.p1  ORF type:complete len:245 (-),score=63.72 GGOE01060018.1:403-1137(-)